MERDRILETSIAATFHSKIIEFRAQLHEQ